AVTPDIVREVQPQLRPQAERERNPSSFERRQEQEGKSNWSGGVWAGRVDRSRGHMNELEKWSNGKNALTPERRLMNEALAKIGAMDAKPAPVPPARPALARRSGRLLFAVDLTSSRDPTLREARIAMAAMFDTLRSIGAEGLAVKLAYYR